MDDSKSDPSHGDYGDSDSEGEVSGAMSQDGAGALGIRVGSPVRGQEQLSPAQRLTRRVTKDMAEWVPNKDANNCQCCATKFSPVKRKHHCRLCGHVICERYVLGRCSRGVEVYRVRTA